MNKSSLPLMPENKFSLVGSLRRWAVLVTAFALWLTTLNLSYSTGLQWCKGLSSYRGDSVWPLFPVELAGSDDWLPPGTYKIKLKKQQTGTVEQDYGYIQLTLKSDRSFTSYQYNTWSLGASSAGDISAAFYHDGKLYSGSTIVGSVSGTGDATWTRLVCTEPQCSLTSFQQFRPNILLKVALDPCPDANTVAGESTAANHSIHYSLGLGAGTNALGRGSLALDSEIASTNLAKPGALRLLATSDFKVITTNSHLRQILSAQLLADIVTNSIYGYEVRLYKASNAGSTNANGLYEPQLSNMVKQVTIENPDTTNSFNRLWITEVEGSLTNQYQYTYLTNSTGDSNTWELLYPGNLRKDVTTTVWDVSRMKRTNTFQVFTPGSPDWLNYQDITELRDDGFGDVLVRQVVGTNGVSLTNTWDYYTNSSETYRYGKIAQKTRWDGLWESFGYDDKGRETNHTTGYLNATNGSAANLCRVLTTSYAGNAANTTGLVTRVEQVLGQETARNYTLYYSTSNSFWTVQCTTPGATPFATDNSVTKVNRDRFNRPTNIFYPDYTKAFYAYVTNSDYSVTTTVSRGQTNGPGTAILEGMKTISVVGPYGETVSNIVINISGGTDGIILERDSYTYATDDFARQYPTITHLDGTTTSGSSGCCGSPNTGNTVAKDGTTTYFVEDALKRRVSATVNNITSSNLFDAYGNSLVTLRIGSDASVITNRIAIYDTAAQLFAETNALNAATLYTNWIDGSGQLVKQNTYADGGTRIETYYRDGQLQSVTGTAVAPVRYVYGVVSDGGVQRAYSAEIKLDAAFADTSERTTNFVDMVGRSYKIAYAAASGTPFAISYYNTKGQLTNQVDADGVSTLYAYNPKGELAYTILDVDRDYTIDWSGDDRISYVTNDVVNNGTADVHRSRTYVWNTSANSSNLVSTAENSVDGLRSWNTIWNNGTAITSQSRTVYDAANGYRYVTNIAPDNSYSVAITRYGTNVSVTAFDSLNNQLSSINYSYDSHGRQNSVTDARIGTTTFTFNNADQVVTTTTPVPASGQSAQIITNYFDAMARVWKTALADGGVITNDFSLLGQAQTISGARTYASGNGYDVQGRFKSLTNWSVFPSAGARATTWNYDSYRGWLTNKGYPDGTGPSYTYSDAGRLKTRLWARGTNATYVYNNAGDLSATFYSDGMAGITNTFDRLGRTTSVTNGTSVCNYTFNILGLMLAETNTSGVLSGLSVTNGYDQFLRRTNLAINPPLSTINSAYGYDNASRLKSVTSGTNSATYSYLANSPLVNQIFYTNGGTLRMTRSNQFDNLNRLTNLVWSAGGSNVASFAYQYNSANQRTRATLADGSYWLYQYDALGQVTSSKKYWSDGTPVAGQQTTFDFDDIGNRKSAASGGDSSGANLRSAYYTNNLLNQITGRSVPGYVDVLGSATNIATVTVNNQATYRRNDYFRAELTANNTSSSLWFDLTNVAVLNNGTNADIVASTTGFVFVAQSPEIFGHDLDGNLTNSGRWAINWDAENRATAFTRISSAPSGSKVKVDCQYDYLWRRTQKIVSTWNGSAYVAQSTNKFVYDGWNLIAVLDATNGLVQSFQWGTDASGTLQGAGGVGGLISMTVHQGTNAGTYFCCFDGNHNVTTLVNATSGVVSGEYECDAFGNILKATGALAFVNPFVFSTKFCDWETGFYYYGYRYYDPSSGRWFSRDPNGETGTVTLYAMLGNNPINSTDLLGLEQVVLKYDLAYDGPSPLGVKDVQTWPQLFSHAQSKLKKCDCIKLIQIGGHGTLDGVGGSFGDGSDNDKALLNQDTFANHDKVVAKPYLNNAKKFPLYAQSFETIEALKQLSKLLCKDGKVEFVSCSTFYGPSGAALKGELEKIFGPGKVTGYDCSVKWGFYTGNVYEYFSKPGNKHKEKLNGPTVY
jgi:RHS repeat-associated protein